MNTPKISKEDEEMSIYYEIAQVTIGRQIAGYSEHVRATMIEIFVQGMQAGMVRDEEKLQRINGAMCRAYQTFKPASSNHASGARYVIQCVADALETDNPQFDRTRFMKACGVSS